MSRGLRNNNPGNIRISNDVYQGEITPSKDGSFKQFQNMAYGYRAIFVILNTYRKRGLNTIAKIINRWAPPSENDTNKYIKFVSESSGIPIEKPLNEYDGQLYIKIVAAISKMENGVDPIVSDIESGFKLQSNIK